MRASYLAVLLLLVGGCQPRWQTLIPGQEERIAAIVEPADGELRADFEWHNAWVDDSGVTVTYGPLGEPPISCFEAPVCLRLEHPSQASDDDLMAGDFALRVWARGEGQALVADGRLVGGVARRLEATGGFWRNHLAWALVLCEGALALLLLAGLGALSWRRVRWRGVLAVAGLSCAAWALRLFAAPVGPFHENHHGLISAHHVVTGGPPVHHVTSAHFALLQLPVQWFGGGEVSLYALTALVGALAAPLWGLVASRISGSRAAGWLAAVTWAVTPLAVRMAPTETPFVLATLLLPAGALALSWGLEQLPQIRAWLALALATLFLALLAQTRIITVLMPPAAVLLAVAMVPRLRGRQWGALVMVILVAGLVSAPHVLDILRAAGARAADAKYVGLASLADSLLGMRLLPFRPAYVAPTLLPLALLGAAWLWRRNGWRGMVAAGAGGWMVLATGLVSTCTSLHMALELPLVAILGAFSAVGMVALGRLLRPQWVSWGVVVALALTSLLPWSVFTLAPPEVQEYRFIADEVLPRLRAADTAILYVAPETEEGRQVIPLAWWQLRLPAVAVRTWVAGEAMPDGAFVYRGLSEVPLREACDGGESPGPAMAVVGREVVVRRIVAPEDRFLCGEIPRCGSYELALMEVNQGG